MIAIFLTVPPGCFFISTHWTKHRKFYSQQSRTRTLRFQIFASHARNIFDRDALGTSGLAFAVVGAIAKTFFVHLLHHAQDTSLALRLPLRQQRHLRNFSTDKKRSRRIGTCPHACAATDADCRIHGLFGNIFGHGNRIRLRRRTGVHGDITARSDDAIKSATIDHQIFDHRKRARAEWFDRD